MTITLTPETHARLQVKAAQLGQDPDSVADRLLAGALDDAEDDAGDDDDLAPEAVAAIRRGIGRGLEAFAQGRYRPLEALIAEKRDRYGLDL